MVMFVREYMCAGHGTPNLPVCMCVALRRKGVGALPIFLFFGGGGRRLTRGASLLLLLFSSEELELDTFRL